ncbi:hypothetical protein Tco_1303762 [Tanacetum coccineum]
MHYSMFIKFIHLDNTVHKWGSDYQNTRNDIIEDMDNASEQNANNASTNDARSVDLRCVVVSKKALKWTLVAFVIGILMIGVTVTLVILLPKHKSRSPAHDQDTESGSPQHDQYTEALHKALMWILIFTD